MRITATLRQCVLFTLRSSIFTSLCVSANAQTYNGSLTISSQAQIDAFNYTSVTGNLIIQEDIPGSITNLDGLSELTSVDGDLTIGGSPGNTALTNVNGLSNLESIGQDLNLYHNHALENVDGLSKIRTLRQLFLVDNNFGNIDGLHNLTTVSEGINVKDNLGLAQLNGFVNLSSTGYPIVISGNTSLTGYCGLYTYVTHTNLGSVSISGNKTNPSYADIKSGCGQFTGNVILSSQAQVDAFDYTGVTGNLIVQEYKAGDITNVGGLSDLNSLSGTLTVQNNTSLTSYCGLYTLFNAGYSGQYTITGNSQNPTSAQIINGGICPIYTGDIAFTTQAEIDAFNFTAVTGTITIQEATPGTITNLDGLSELTSIGKDFLIKDNTAFANIDGLANLTSIGGTLDISRSMHLTNLDGLHNLKTIGTDLSIIGSGLTNIDGFSNVTSIGGGLFLDANSFLANLDGLSHVHSLESVLMEDNLALTNVNGLSELQTITGLITHTQTLWINRNPLLANLDGFTNLVSVGGEITIMDNAALTNIDGLSKLSSVKVGIVISGNNSLTNIDGLSSIKSFNLDDALVEILIGDNPKLTDVNGLTSIQDVFKLNITGNASLENLDGLFRLNTIVQFTMCCNNALTNIDGLSNVYAINQLNIINNSSLSQFCGLYNVVSRNGVSETFAITGNLSNPTASEILAGGKCSNIQPDFILTSQAEVDAFNYSLVPGNLTVEEDVPGDIKNLDGLSELTSVMGNFLISSNTALTSITGLSNLTDVEGSLSLDQAIALQNLNGLSNLTTVRKSFSISHNSALQSIAGLSGLSNVGTIGITGNDLLSNIDGLIHLTTVESIVVTDNPILKNLDGLSNVSSLESILSIRSNPKLENIDGLSGLTSVGAASDSRFPGLQIRLNDILTNLDGLSHLQSVKGNLDISANPVLSKFCGLYTLLSEDGLGGTYGISFNAQNPTIQQILDGGLCSSPTNPVTVTINKASTQADPTNISPIHFTVTFSEDVTGFDASDISFAGSTAGTTLTAVVTGGPSTYDIAVAGMTANGDVVASVPAGVAMTATSQLSQASSSTDNTVTYIFNTCPSANTLNFSIGTGLTLHFQLSGSDLDKDPLTYSLSLAPAHGLVNVPINGMGSYVPATGYSGSDQFTYKVSDGKCDEEAVANITIIICPGGNGSWKNKSTWPVASLSLGTRSYNKTQLLSILKTPTGSGNGADASLILADQLIATKLNLAQGSPQTNHINDSIGAADALIGSALIPMKVKPNTAAGKRMTALASFLASYNGGTFTQGCSLPLTTKAVFETEGEQIAGDFRLEQNYPNPYHHTTIIKYILPAGQNGHASYHVTLKVFDMLGREVKTLVDDTETEGSKSLAFDATGLGAGIYFYRITADTFTATKKMTLAK